MTDEKYTPPKMTLDEALEHISRVHDAADAREALVAELDAKIKRLLAGGEPDVWPCGCTSRILDSCGREEIVDGAACDYHKGLVARVKDLEVEVERLRKPKA